MPFLLVFSFYGVIGLFIEPILGVSFLSLALFTGVLPGGLSLLALWIVFNYYQEEHLSKRKQEFFSELLSQNNEAFGKQTNLKRDQPSQEIEQQINTKYRSCPNCGQKVDSIRFCGFCGVNLVNLQ
ncbi:MAG: hypothetical protein ACFFC7_06850 [Candidatus Hermodarchaeota archaeon]